MRRQLDQTGLLDPIDAKWGFQFGVDGVMGTTQACEFLGGISRDTLDRLAKDGLIRKGKIGSKVAICLKSARHFLSGLEV